MGIKELSEELLTPAAQIALIIGLAEVCKRLGIKTKYIPLIDLGLGLLSGIGIFGLVFGYGIPQGIVIGIAIGLSACGLFSGTRAVLKPSQPEMEPEDNVESYTEVFEENEKE